MRTSNNVKPSDVHDQCDNGSCECRLYSGFKSIDDIVHGFGKGEVCVLASAPSKGATALALSIAECVSLGRNISGDAMTGNHGAKHSVMIVSLAETMRNVINRMSISLAGWWQGATTSIPTAEGIALAEKEIATLPIYIKAYGIPGGSREVEISRMVSDVCRMASQHRIELVVVDYLNLLCDSISSLLGRSYELLHIMGVIKFLAQGLNCAILLLANASRPTNVDWKDYKSVLSDLRWNSPAIESLIDVVMLLNRPLSQQTPRGGPAFLNIAKNCHGETGEIELEFLKSSIRFAERPSTQASSSVSPERP